MNKNRLIVGCFSLMLIITALWVFDLLAKDLENRALVFDDYITKISEINKYRNSIEKCEVQWMDLHETFDYTESELYHDRPKELEHIEYEKYRSEVVALFNVLSKYKHSPINIKKDAVYIFNRLYSCGDVIRLERLLIPNQEIYNKILKNPGIVTKTKVEKAYFNTRNKILGEEEYKWNITFQVGQGKRYFTMITLGKDHKNIYPERGVDYNSESGWDIKKIKDDVVMMGFGENLKVFLENSKNTKFPHLEKYEINKEKGEFILKSVLFSHFIFGDIGYEHVLDLKTSANKSYKKMVGNYISFASYYYDPIEIDGYTFFTRKVSETFVPRKNGSRIISRETKIIFPNSIKINHDISVDQILPDPDFVNQR